MQLDGLTEIRDFSPLATLKSLTHLWIRGCVLPVSVLRPLRCLESITFYQAFPEGGLPALGEARPDLTELMLWQCDEMHDLSPLRRLTRLRELALPCCSRVGDLKPLCDLSDLALLDLRGCQSGLNLSPLAGRRLALWLDKGQQVSGLNTLGPDVRVEWM